MMIRKAFMCVVLIGFMATMLPLQTAKAIPAFARKYKLSCSTCHVAIPKLKPYGEEFAANGFILPKGQEPKRAYVNTGDDLLLLNRTLPFAVRFDAFAQAADRSEGQTDLQTPYGIKLLSGGAISKKVSYYFYFYIFERGDVAGLEDAYLHFNDLFGAKFDIMVGQFQVSDPLFKRELRLTFEDYLIYRFQPETSRIRLTYDRGVMLSYGFNFGLDLFGEVLNGNGIPSAHDRVYDTDNSKSFALRASQNFGALRLGLFGYWGREKVDDRSNDVVYIGPDFTFSAPHFELNCQYLHREDSSMLPQNDGFTTLKTDGGFLELIYLPNGDRSRLLFTALYNKIKTDEKGAEYDGVTAGATYVYARNLRFLGEVAWDFITDKPRLTLGIVSAF